MQTSKQNEGFYIFNDPGTGPKPILQAQYFCLTTIFVGFAAELFVILAEFRQMKRISGQYLDWAAEITSIEYKRSCLVTQLISIVLKYFSLFFAVYRLKKIWRRLHSNTQFSIAVFFFAEIVVLFPPSLHKHFYVERKFGFNRMSVGTFIRDTFLKIAIHFVIYYAFLLPIFVRARKIIVQAPKKRKNKLHIVETKAVVDLVLGGDLSDLSDVEIEDESDDTEDGEQFFEQASNLWIFASIHLFFLLLLASFVMPKTEYLFNDIIPGKSTNLTQKYNALVSGLKGNIGLDLEIILPTRTTHASWKISGFWFSKPLITETTLELLQQSELKAVGRHLSRTILEGYNLKSLIFSLVPIMFFGVIFKAVMSHGLAPYGVHRGRPMAVVMFIVFCFFNTMFLSGSIFIRFIKEKSVYNTDCDVSKEIVYMQDPTGAIANQNLRDAIIKIYRINNMAAEPSTLYHLFYDDMPTLVNRINNIDLCRVSRPVNLV
jgi:hypothetical protein